MINIPANLITCGLGVALTLMIIINSRHSIRKAFYEDKLYYRMAFLIMALNIIELLGFLVDDRHFQGARFLNILTNTLLFVGNTYFAITWFYYVLFRIKGERFKFNLKHIAICSLGIVSFVCIFINLFHPVYFEVSQANIYSRKPAVIISYFSTYGYLLASILIVMKNIKRLDRYVFMPVIVFLVPAFIASIVQFFFYGIGVIWVATSFGLLSLYISIQNEYGLLDSITKLYNREFFTRYLRSYRKNAPKGALLGGCMIDVNHFKKINDTFGHEEGDRALEEIARILRAATEDKDLISRYGGDEFIIIREINHPREIDSLADSIERECLRSNREKNGRPYNISLAVGTGVMDTAIDTTDDFLHNLDVKMYKSKAEYYQEHPTRKLNPDHR